MKAIFKYLLTLCLAGLAATSVYAQNQKDLSAQILGRDDAYFIRGQAQDIYGRFTAPAPVFIVFPDTRTSQEGAIKMVEESGMKKVIDDFGGSVYFMNPLGEKYDNATDFEAYKGFINRLKVMSNIKVIGIGNGATFVSETIARNAGNVAGIVCVGGKASKHNVNGESPVPAYIAGKNAAKIAFDYISRLESCKSSKSGKTGIYQSADEPLLKVVVNTNDAKELKDVFADAWEQLLSHNYRFNNVGHTWYTGESYAEHGDSELEPFIIFDRLGITRNVCTANLTGAGEYLWYEYIPEAVKTAADASVPLVVLLHGNNNDPRTQAETSGFLPVAAREGFMVAELEWQGNGWAVMGHDGIETVIYELFKRYPQIDRSRVYAEGLSAGAFNATALGIKKTHVFAAVGAQSGGISPAYRFGSSKDTLFDEAILKSDGCDMPYFSISGTADEVVPCPTPNQEGPTIHLAWQAYQIINNLPVKETLDFSADNVFGMKMDNRTRVNTLKGISYDSGDLCKNGVPLMRIVHVENYGHWNFQPGAELMWNYFKMFSRDPQTKKLIYHQ